MPQPATLAADLARTIRAAPASELAARGLELARVVTLEGERRYANSQTYAARRMLDAPANDRAGWALILADAVLELDGWRAPATIYSSWLRPWTR